VSEHLGFSRSTVYRYLADLCEHGLLAQGSGNAFVLGPKIFSLEYRLRKSDPLTLAGRPIVQSLVEEFGGTALVNRLFRDRFICVDFETSLPEGQETHRRGQPMPLVRGANARAIQAHLPRHRLVRIYEENAAEFAASGLGRDFGELQAKLREVRAAGVCLSDGELRPGIVGIAAPILVGPDTVVGTLGFVDRSDALGDRRREEVMAQVRLAARILSRQLSQG